VRKFDSCRGHSVSPYPSRLAATREFGFQELLRASQENDCLPRVVIREEGDEQLLIAQSFKANAVERLGEPCGMCVVNESSLGFTFTHFANLAVTKATRAI
jgi:hypothetical protein